MLSLSVLLRHTLPIIRYPPQPRGVPADSCEYVECCSLWISLSIVCSGTRVTRRLLGKQVMENASIAQTVLIGAMQDFLKEVDHILIMKSASRYCLVRRIFEDQRVVEKSKINLKSSRREESIVELLAEERLQKANQVLNESQSPQEMRIQDLEIQKQQCLEEMKEWMNDLGIREIRKEEIDIDYRRKCEKIYELG
ncbi:hypothetical protein Tco_0396502 [Tanacetum coccineum]